MEDELGKQLIIRGNRKITLTEEGLILRKRAEEIIELVQKTEHEITVSDDAISGDVYIGAGETDAVRLLAKAGKRLQLEFPDIHYHISSGDTQANYFLANTTYTIKEIAELLGFNQLCNFYDFCKKNYGMTPAEYRKQHNDQCLKS